MSEFTLPSNSKVGTGKHWPVTRPSAHVKSFRIYRWDPAKKTFLITGKLWPKMFEVVFVPAAP